MDWMDRRMMYAVTRETHLPPPPSFSVEGGFDSPYKGVADALAPSQRPPLPSRKEEELGHFVRYHLSRLYSMPRFVGVMPPTRLLTPA